MKSYFTVLKSPSLFRILWSLKESLILLEKICMPVCIYTCNIFKTLKKKDTFLTRTLLYTGKLYDTSSWWTSQNCCYKYFCLQFVRQGVFTVCRNYVLHGYHTLNEELLSVQSIGNRYMLNTNSRVILH